MFEPHVVNRVYIECKNTIVVKDGTPYFGESVQRSVNVVQRQSRKDIIAERGRELWSELHAKQDPTPEWFQSWISKIPNYSCKCRDWLREYIVINPPRYDDWHVWSVECHRAVSCKLDKPGWSILVYDRDTVAT